MITPPPGLIAVTPPNGNAGSDGDGESADQKGDRPESFITLPPGVVDSGTYRVVNPRVVTAPRVSTRDEIVFFPSPPGVPATLASAPAEASGDDPEATRVARHASPQWRLVFPGEPGMCTVDDAVFLGRDPVRSSDRPNAQVLALIDSAKTLSKTHAMVEVDEGQLWVTDLGSTNGVFIVPSSGDPIDVLPGTRAPIPIDSNLELGEFVVRIEFN